LGTRIIFLPIPIIETFSPLSVRYEARISSNLMKYGQYGMNFQCFNLLNIVNLFHIDTVHHPKKTLLHSSIANASLPSRYTWHEHKCLSSL